MAFGSCPHGLVLAVLSALLLGPKVKNPLERWWVWRTGSWIPAMPSPQQGCWQTREDRGGGAHPGRHRLTNAVASYKIDAFVERLKQTSCLSN